SAQPHDAGPRPTTCTNPVTGLTTSVGSSAATAASSFGPSRTRSGLKTSTRGDGAAVSFDPFARALLDAFAHLERRITAIEQKLEANQKMLDGDVYLTPKEVARLRGVSASAIRARIQAGRIPAVQEGKLWFIRRADVEPPSS